MKTIVTESPLEAAEFIKAGGLTAFPTETVYGLGANVFDEAAIRKIFAAKDRPADNPLIAHIGAAEQIERLAREVSDTARLLIQEFFPGPLTVVLKKRAGVSDTASAGLDTIGIRMPKHPLANAFLQACGVPVAAPSANLSGRPSPTTWQAVLEDLDGRIDCILKGEATEIGLESTVVDCTGDVPVVLRSGAVTIERLRGVVPNIRAFRPDSDEPARSPGMRHRHYSPRAEVRFYERGESPGAGASAFIGISPPSEYFDLKLICGSPEEYAHELFAFFRRCDNEGIAKIYCEPVAGTGIGAALMDRLRRAVSG